MIVLVLVKIGLTPSTSKAGVLVYHQDGAEDWLGRKGQNDEKNVQISRSIQESLEVYSSQSNETQSLVEDDLINNEFVRIPYIFDKFTMVTPTYKRTENLPYLLNHYCPMTDIIHKIIILWNNIGITIPPEIVEKTKICGIPVVIKTLPRNNLTSRFLPYEEIETAG